MAIQITIDTKLTGQEIIDLLKNRKFGYTTDNTTGIYQIKNLINNKIYIGSSCSLKKGIKNRWYWHINKLNSNSHYSSHLQNSWNKYKSSNFEFSVLEIINIEKDENKKDFENRIREKEREYILKFNSWKSEFGYNLTRNTKSSSDFLTEEKIKQGKWMLNWEDYLKMKEKLIATNIPLAEIAREFKIGRKVLERIYRGQLLYEEYKDIDIPSRTISFYDILKENYEKDIVKDYVSGISLDKLARKYYKIIGRKNIDDTRPIKLILEENNIKIRSSTEVCSIKIYQYDFSGKFIKEWSSITKAAREYNISNSKITACASGKRNTAKGYRWSYEKLDYLPLENIYEQILGRPYNSRNRPILRFSLNWEPEVIYGSLRSTSAITGKSYEYLGLKINKDKNSIAYGHHWQYLDTLEEKELKEILKLRRENKIKIVDNIYNSKYKQN